MPSRRESATARARHAEALTREAAQRYDVVAQQAATVVARAKRDLRSAARSGAYLRVIELLKAHGLAAVGSVSYLLIALVGLAYSYGYYRQFDGIHIFGLFDTSDFFLSAFGNLGALSTAFFAPLVLLVLLGLSFWWLNIRRARIGTRNRRDARLVVLTVVLVPVSVLLTLSASFLIATADSLLATARPDWVEVRLRGESAHWGPADGSGTVLLGTTSEFHVFLECGDNEEDNGRKDDEGPRSPDLANSVASALPTDGPAIEIEGASEQGRDNETIEQGGTDKSGEEMKPISCEWSDADAFVVPNSNIASVVFMDTPAPLSPATTETNGDSGSGAEIAELREIIAKLQSRIDAGSGDVSNVEIVNLVSAITELHANLAARNAINGLNATIGRSPSAETLGLVVQAINNLRGSSTAPTPSSGARLRPPCPCKLAVIGPFEERQHELPRQSPGDGPMSAAVTVLRRWPPEEIMLIGRVDVSPLGEVGLGIYGSDHDLAKQRAEWVQRALAESGVDVETLVIGTGPLHLGGAEAADRVVEIWACWAS